MDDKPFKNSKYYYYKIYNNFQKKFSTFEFYLIYKKQNFTDNIFYYFLCILFRFIPLIILSIDFLSINRRISNSMSFKQYLQKFTCHFIIAKFNFSYGSYFIIYSIIYLLHILRILINVYIIRSFYNNKNKYSNKWYFLNKYKIIMEHIIFLFFPYIIEFFSFPFYIYFFRDKFIIKLEDNIF